MNFALGLSFHLVCHIDQILIFVKTMRIILATNHLFAWTGSEITLGILAASLKDIGHDVLVYSDFYSTENLIADVIPSCHYTSSLDEVEKFRPQVAYTQHHSVALNIRSVCPSIPIAHAMLGILPHLEKFPQIDLGISRFLPISEEVASTLPEGLGAIASVSIFRNIVDDRVFTSGVSINKLESICCYSYKVSESKYKALSIVANERGLKLFDRRSAPGGIPYRDVPRLLKLGDVVVASGRGAIEAMLCGKVPLIMSDCGDDGLVTPENFQMHMRTNFSGRTTSRNFDAELIGFELDRFRPSYGSELQILARHYFGLSVRKSQISDIFEGLTNAVPVSLPLNKINEIKFISKTLELQRTFAAASEKLRKDSINEAHQKCEGKIYISEIVEGVPQSYMESRGAVAFYTISRQRQVVRFSLPEDLKPLARMRLDLSNRPVGVWLQRLTLLRADCSEIWHWDGSVQLFSNAGGLAMFQTNNGLLIVCWNNDPQFELMLPPGVLASLNPHDCLEVELTPCTLQDACAEIFNQDGRFIADIFASATRAPIGSTVSISAEAIYRAPAFTMDLEKIAILLKNKLALRDQTIAEQSKHIQAMRDELLRAEAKLDVLKYVMLGSRNEDRG